MCVFYKFYNLLDQNRKWFPIFYWKITLLLCYLKVYIWEIFHVEITDEKND